MKLFEGVTLQGGLEKTGNVLTVQYTQEMLIKLSLLHKTDKNINTRQLLMKVEQD